MQRGLISEAKGVTVITFLGAGRYEPVTYFFRDREVRSAYFQVALADFFRPRSMIVMATAEAEAKHWMALTGELDPGLNVTLARIPWGRNEPELWDIFDCLVDVVKENGRVVFDVTHSFRSLPLVLLLAIAYLKVAWRLRLEGLVYGAYEARDGAGRAPVFDLSPFIKLLDWLAAVYLFQESGRAGPLADLVRESQDRPHQEGRSQAPRRLKVLGQKLDGLSQALAVTRPLEAAQIAGSLLESARAGQAEIARWAKPLQTIIPLILKEVEPFAGAGDLRELDLQQALVRWYLERGKYVNALALAREWLVNRVAVELGEQDLAAPRVRRRAEIVLGYLGKVRQEGAPVSVETPPKRDLQALGKRVDLSRLGKGWNRLSDCRNDALHAGMRVNPSPARSLIRNARNSIDECVGLFGASRPAGGADPASGGDEAGSVDAKTDG